MPAETSTPALLPASQLPAPEEARMGLCAWLAATRDLRERVGRRRLWSLLDYLPDRRGAFWRGVGSVLVLWPPDPQIPLESIQQDWEDSLREDMTQVRFHLATALGEAIGAP